MRRGGRVGRSLPLPPPPLSSLSPFLATAKYPVAAAVALDPLSFSYNRVDWECQFCTDLTCRKSIWIRFRERLIPTFRHLNLKHGAALIDCHDRTLCLYSCPVVALSLFGSQTITKNFPFPRSVAHQMSLNHEINKVAQFRSI